MLEMTQTGIDNLTIDDHGLPPTQAAMPSQSSLISLPFDILRAIVWDERLKRNDAEALRLTCRALSDVAATRLFYRISISKLNTDRDAFLSICRSPHLAPHVREVEWLEISWDVNIFQRIAAQFAPVESFDEDDIESLCCHLHTATEGLCWLSNVPARGEYTDGDEIELRRQTAVAEFRDVFEAAVDLLPNLHTFVSRPMASRRIITPDAEYPIVASLFQAFQDSTKLPATPQTNDGLFFFLIPAMRRPTSTVTRLRWADEFPGFSYLRSLPVTAFERLDSLELCLTPSKDLAEDSFNHLTAACLHAAGNLRHFKLCVEHGSSAQSPSIMERLLVGDILVTAPGCALRSLSLISVQVSEDRLMHVIGAIATSLRHVYFENMDIRTSVITRLAELNLNLSTMKVVSDDALELVCERDLVGYINGELDVKGADGEVGVEQSDNDIARNTTDVCELVKKNGVRWATTRLPEDAEYDEYERNWAARADSESETSEDSFEYRHRTAPRWVWARYFHDDAYDFVFCSQVPESSTKGYPTKIWRFTNRDGDVAYGNDPYVWFDDWDPEAGDFEEPTPYCERLRRFSYRSRSRSIADILGEESEAWKLLRALQPPKDAFEYLFDEDPTRDSYWREQQGYETDDCYY